MINSIIHHIGIAVTKTVEAENFYDLLLVNYLGLIKEDVWESKAGWKGRGSKIYIYESTLLNPGFNLQHLAFTARNRKEVEDFPTWALAKGISIISNPKEYPEYGKDYFAVFFSGPDNIKLELVYLTESDHAIAL